MLDQHRLDPVREFARAQKRMRNQARYSNVDILTQYRMKDGRDRFSFERDTRGAGLLHHLIEHWTFRSGDRVWFIPDQFIDLVKVSEGGTLVRRGSQGQLRIDTVKAAQFLTDETTMGMPVAFPFLYQPGEEEAKGFSYSSILHSLGILVIEERWCWRMHHPVFQYINRTFRQAVEMQPYVGSLMVPCKPGGILLDCPVVVRTIGHGRDGSGLIHPMHPLVSQLVEAGHEDFSVIQIRIWNSKGFFAKGILELDRNSVDREGLPTITVCTKMIKGAGKSKAKAMLTTESVATQAHIGVIDVIKHGKISCGFEFWENIQTNETTWAIIQKKLQKNFKKFSTQGFEGAVNQLRKTHPGLDQTIQFLEELNRSLGRQPNKLDILSVPWAWSMLQEDIQARLYKLVLGAGVRMPSLPVVCDDRVARGTCVVASHPPGTPMVAFRMPIVASQVITRLVVAEPQPHHCFDDIVKPNIIYLNSHDIGIRMAGDDDGDIIGISNDPDLIMLADNLVDDRVFKIEGGVATLDMLTLSNEGRVHIATDQQGPVGKLTYMRSRLLVAGLLMPAVAISCLIQEAIDRAKKTIHSSNWELSSDIANWDLRDGVWHLREEARLFDGEIRTGELDLRAVTRWVNRLLVKSLGGTETVSSEGRAYTRPHNAIAWMVREKTILTESWATTQDSSPVQGNLIHRIHDETWALWQPVADRFTKGETVPLDTLLHRLLMLKGISIQVNDLGWADYRNQTRERVGVNRYRDQISQGMKMPRRDDDQIRRRKQVLDRATDEFHQQLKRRISSQEISLQDLVDVWLMETRHIDQGGNPNYAFQAIVWADSPIMALLGIKPQARCGFLTPEREQRILDLVLRPSAEQTEAHGFQLMDGFQRLTSLMLKSQAHAKECYDSAGIPIQGWDCPDCIGQLRINLVRQIRSNTKASEHRYFKRLITELNLRLRA